MFNDERLADTLSERLAQFKAEDEFKTQKLDQVGTSIPKFIMGFDQVVVNPSNVGLSVIARMIETDETVFSSVLLKSLMMLSKIGEYHHDKPELKDFVNDFLAKMEGPTWPEALEAMSSSYGYGFSVSEIVWGLNKQMQKVPVKVPTYHPTTICFETDDTGQVTPNGVIQFSTQYAQYSNPNQYWPTVSNGFYVKNPFTTPVDRTLPHRITFVNTYGATRIPKDKVIHQVNHSMFAFGSPYGKTSVRTAHLAWQLKVFFMKQMGVAGKRAATPMVWAQAPHNKNKLQFTMPDGRKVEMNPIEAMRYVLGERETDDAVVTGAKADGYGIDVLPSAANLQSFIDVINNLDVRIFRAFVLPSLVMTDGSAGSRSLGDKHFQIVDRIAESDALKFAQTVVNQMIRPAIEQNFGHQDDYGKFLQRPQSIEERERLTNMFMNLGNSGWLGNQSEADVAFVRSSLHIPEDPDASFYKDESPIAPHDDEDTPTENDPKLEE